MANDTEQAQSPSAELAAAAPEQQPRHALEFYPLRDESRNAMDQEKYGRARTHIAGLGHVSAKDVFKDYRRSWLTPFFGSNEPEPTFQQEGTQHPCQIFSREVHRCLEDHHNSFAFCQTRVAAFQQCLREFSM
ncbi:hypothetical protein, conserved [Leishmania donovani]|uniref:Uncharacterized protein n=1 Tax=Leishmania donovani TaxID=5661 RepID=A0A3Q8IH69_LEIDO|nr:hypothetical protein, conserved [Leishmania donovani]AYU81822.1 hypothetical protein LdCL_320033100 [Leishmania donovani]TPP43781.1 hypothetical protein CGC21_20900 [Leishmania donovani]CBZ37002.1 hypothetical protein, conserved [Leishmania donovani]